MENTVPTDSQLIAEIRDGSADALEELVSRYESRVYSLAYRMLGNKEDAEDVLQDTFLNVVRSIDGFKSQSSFSTWLYRVAANAALTKLRQKSKREKSEGEFLDEVYSVREATHSESSMVDWSDGPADRLLNEEARQVMEEAITELPEKYRIVFVLRDVEGMPAAEVAKALDLSIPAVKSRLHRARLYLRNRLSHYYTGETV